MKHIFEEFISVLIYVVLFLVLFVNCFNLITYVITR